MLIAAIHTVIQARYGGGQASRVVLEVLRISSRSSDMDVERILEQTNARLLISEDSEDSLDFHEAILVPYASALGADAVIARRPHFLGELCGHENEPLSCEVPILKLTSVFSFLSQQERFHKEETILVMTPGNRIIRLPKGATPLDFAYKVHTDLGDNCERIFVNDIEVPLNTELRTGNVVRVETGNRSNPDLEWLKFVKTHAAKKGIRRGRRRFQLQMGWEAIKQALGTDVRIYHRKLEYVAQTLGQKINQLVIKVGAGEVDIKTLQALMAEYNVQPVELKEEWPESVNVLLEGRPCKLASCCNPFPDDSIMGILGKNDGALWVHQTTCQHLEKVGVPQQFPIIWNEQHCWVQLSLLLSDRADTLRPLLNRLVEEYRLSPDLRSVTIDKLGRCWVVIKLPVASRQQLDNITARIRTAPEVRRIKTSKIPSVSWADGCLTKNQTINVFSEEQ